MIDVGPCRRCGRWLLSGRWRGRPMSSGSRPRRCRSRSRGWNARSVCPSSRRRDAGSCSLGRPGHRRLSARSVPRAGALRRSGPVSLGGRAARHTPRGCLLDCCPRLLAPTILRLSTRCPDLRVHITEQDPDQALHSVDAGSADLALVHDADGLPAPLPSSLTQRHMHTDVGDVVMNRTHPLARLDPPLAGADLAGHAWVTSPPGSVCHQWFRRLFADVPEDPDVRHLVDDFATQLSLVASRRRYRPDPSPCSPALGRRARLPVAAAATEARGTRGVAAQRQCQPSDPSGARGARLRNQP